MFVEYFIKKHIAYYIRRKMNMQLLIEMKFLRKFEF